MGKFKTADKVVCTRPGDPVNGLIKDNIYTVELAFEDYSGADSVELVEVEPPAPLKGYLAFRFRLATDVDLQIEELAEMVN